MKTRADFLRAQKGRRKSQPGLTLEICASPAVAAKSGAARVGFTASRKVGGAVERNRAKRRLRAAAASTLPLLGREGHDYVLVARAATISRPFAELVGDLCIALDAAHAAMDQAGVAAGSLAKGQADGKRQPDERGMHHG
jgi:ribonuclease P protein component